MGRWWLLIPVVLFGACAAIAVPNLLTAMQRSKEKRTMADIRMISTAIEGYWSDHPDWKPGRSEGSLVRLASLLQPKYVKQIPHKDGWERPLHVTFDATRKGDESYTIWSTGRDGKRDPKWGGANTNFDNDIVFSNGSFTQYPEGT